MRHGMRAYAYGTIKQAIRTVMADCKHRSMNEIIDECPLIDPIVVARNVRAMVSLGEVKNVGTRKAARYQWQG